MMQPTVGQAHSISEAPIITAPQTLHFGGDTNEIACRKISPLLFAVPPIPTPIWHPDSGGIFIWEKGKFTEIFSSMVPLPGLSRICCRITLLSNNISPRSLFTLYSRYHE